MTKPKIGTVSCAINLHEVSRHFGNVRALDGVSLSIEEGEFFSMLGPSGSGKTTCLRLIAGFDRPSTGRIELFGNDVSKTPPYRRAVNTVFQDYALFPHLNVLDNVAFGLKIAGLKRTERTRAARDTLAMVKLPDHENRKPSELSGGQRQRVALARALVNRPKVLLLDEPLGALDLKLREQMQEELKTLQKSLNITFVFVTHDQGEALSMSDRVAVFSEGKILQVGTPQQIYEQPDSRAVADFVGSSNVLPPALVERLTGEHCFASLRPEKISLLASGGIRATVAGYSYLGSSTRMSLELEGTKLNCLLPSTSALPPIGETVNIGWNRQALHLMPASR